MKKSMFALACAASVAAFAGDLNNATGFEGYTNLPFKGLSFKDDTGDSAGSAYWLYLGGQGAEDGSEVVAYGEGEAPAPLKGDESNANFLNLSTEGGTLWRSVAPLENTALNAGTAIPEGGLYIDTMVQFTPTEDGGAPELDPADKLAIWLNVETPEGATDPVTNLCVRAAVVDDEGHPTATTFTITNAGDIQADAWYHLKVEAIADITEGDEIPGFKIYLNDTLLIANRMTLTDDYAELKDLDDVNDKVVFASLRSTEANPTLSAVGFKGSGKLDNLTISDEDPTPPAPASLDFTITVADGVTAEWSTDGNEWTAYNPTTAKADAGTILIRLTTTDGGVKVVSKDLSKDAHAFDLTEETFGWPEYLGAAVDGAYVIDDEAELIKFRDKSLTLRTDGKTFKLGANIALTDTWTGIGLYGKDNVKTDAFADGAFQGVFDGNGNTISGLTLKSDYSGGTSTNKYIGFFFSTKDATIRNVKFGIANYGWDKGKSIADGSGGGIVVGTALSTTFDSVEIVAGETADTQTFYGTHAISAFAGFTSGTCSMTDCVNNLNLEENRSKDAKVAAFSACNQSNTPELTLTRCVNKGKITSTVGSYAAGFVCYNDGTVTLVNCENQGELGAKVYEFVANHDDGKGNYGSTINSGSKGTGAALAVNDTHVTGFAFRDADDGKYADTVEAGKSYKVTAKNAGAITLANVGDSITLDTTLATATVTTTAEDAYVAQDGNDYTVTAKADAEFSVTIDPTEAEWTDTLTLPTPTITGTTATGSWSPAAIVEPDAGTTNVYTYTVTVAATDTTKATTKSVEFKVYKNATVVYPEYIGEDAEKRAKYEAWAKDKNVEDFADTAKANEAAYLLNVAPAEAEAEAGKFKIVSFSIDAEGKVTVIAPAKNSKGAVFNGTVEVKGCATVDGEYTLPVTDSAARFFKAFLK